MCREYPWEAEEISCWDDQEDCRERYIATRFWSGVCYYDKFCWCALLHFSSFLQWRLRNWELLDPACMLLNTNAHTHTQNSIIQTAITLHIMRDSPTLLLHIEEQQLRQLECKNECFVTDRVYRWSEGFAWVHSYLVYAWFIPSSWLTHPVGDIIRNMIIIIMATGVTVLRNNGNGQTITLTIDLQYYIVYALTSLEHWTIVYPNHTHCHFLL